MVLIKFLHLLSLVAWVGGMIFFVTIGAPSIFKVLPRETAGDVLGDIFPKYWIMSYICSAISLITIFILSLRAQFYPWDRIGLLILMGALTLYLGLVVAARAREVRIQIRKSDESSRRESLRTEFKSLHRWSVLLNGIILISGLAVIFLMV